MIRTETMWAVVGNAGLYIGTWLRRREAIAAHINALRRMGDPKLPEWYCTTPLNAAQKAAWSQRQKNGDRVVKVHVSWEDGQ